MGNPSSQPTTVSVTKYALSLSDILYFSDIYFYFTPIFLHRTRYKRALAVNFKQGKCYQKTKIVKHSKKATLYYVNILILYNLLFVLHAFYKFQILLIRLS